MKCHYEVLGVTRNATYDDIKAAYRRLALTWHPDKNLNNPEEAKKQFQRIKQAWDVLGDSHERTWYDNHREAILKGSTEDYKDESINLFPYFSTMCFEGYGDDENDFYTVYRTVFEKIVEEDAEFVQDDESKEEIPGFGNSQSSYEEVVHNFYAYWQSYSTKRSFAWLNPYDLKHASNRRVFRLAEKENRKVRDKARRERNEQVRNLVAFIRKRDKRVQAHAAKLAQRARENARKVEERKKAQVLERQKLLRDHTESEWSKFSNFEAELRKIEETLGDDSDEEDIDDNNTLYCIVCNKIFKTHKAYMNHENSRKHKENFSALEASMAEEEKEFFPSSSFQEIDSTSTESAAPNEPKLATDSQVPDFLLNSSENNMKKPANEDNEDTSPDELISDDEENSRDYQSATQGELKLATDSQMPDFLTNPPKNDTKELDNEDNDNTSQGELISDAEENLKDNQPASKKEKTNDDDVSLTERPRMNYNCFLCLSESGKEDNTVSFEDELISNEETEAASDCQKKKKKNRRRRRKNNVQNSNPVPDRVSDDNTESNHEDVWLSKKQRKKLKQRKAAIQNKSTQAKSDSVNETIANKKGKKKNETVIENGTKLTPLELFHIYESMYIWRKENTSFSSIKMDISSETLTPIYIDPSH